MKTILHNGMALSKLCLGTASMGSNGLSGAPLASAFKILDTYYDMGGRFLDTANVYGRWGVDHTNASEKCIGMWLADRGITDMTITSKCCHYLPEAHDVSRVNKECALYDLDESRRALGIDKIPIYLLHRDNRNTDIRRIVDFCTEMVDSGKIGKFGLSNYRLDRVKEALDYLGADRERYFAGLSNEWSLAMEGAYDDTGYAPPDGMEAINKQLAEYCAKDNILITPFSAAAHGFFDKLARDGVTLGEDGRFVGKASYKPEWMTAENAKNYKILRTLARETGCSMTSISAAYLSGKQQPVIPIVSVSKPEQLTEYTIAMELDLSGTGLGTWNI